MDIKNYVNESINNYINLKKDNLVIEDQIDKDKFIKFINSIRINENDKQFVLKLI